MTRPDEFGLPGIGGVSSRPSSMTETWTLAALWLGLALAAGLASIWLRVATALSEIVVGIAAGARSAR